MAPSSYKKKSGRSTRAEKRSNAVSVDKPAKRNRVEHNVIEGIDIFSFENELNLQYFTNIEEPFPRKIRRFLGFDEDDYEAASLKQIKSSFDRVIKQYNDNGLSEKSESVEVPQGAESSPAILRVPQGAESSPAILRVADDLIVLSDDGSTSPTPVSQPASVINDKPVQISQPADVIEIDDDSDDDVVMVSDPNAPLPKPVRDCVCPNCGKVKRADPNRRVPASDRDSGVEDLSIITDEVAIITDDEEPVVSAPIHNKGTPLQPKDPIPKEMPAHSAYIRQEVPVQPAKVLAEEVSSPAPGEPPGVSVSRSLKVNNASSLTDQQRPSSLSPSRPRHISAKHSNNMSPDAQKPSSQLEPPTTMPKTIRVVSKDSGKTFYLTINGANSKILKPLTTPPSKGNSTEQPQSFHYLHPGVKPCGVSPSKATTTTQVQKPPAKPVVGPGTVEVVKMHQPNLTPKPVVGSGTVEVVKMHQPNLTPKPVVGSGTVGVVKMQQPNLTPKPVVGSGTVGVVKMQQPNLTPKPVVSPLKPIDGTVETPNGVHHTYRITMPQLQSNTLQVTLSAMVQVQVKNSSIVKPGDSIALGSFSEFSEPVVLEDDTKSVVADLIDFVCRQENFPSVYVYDQERTEQLSLDVPCQQLRCRMGCVCVSLAKKHVRRVRCKNVDCIFGCVCISHGVVAPQTRYAKTMPNMKVLGTSRRKQVLTILPDCDAGNGIGPQPALKSFLPVQKVAGVSRAGSVHSSSVSQESSRRSLGPGAHARRQDSGFGTASKDLQFPVNVISKANVASSLRHHPASDPTDEVLAPPDVPKPSAAIQGPGSRLSVPAQPRGFFGREKTPMPERALMCLTPGFGYVPLSEIHPTVTLDSPFKPGSPKSFLSIRQATEWLNAKLKNHLTDKMPHNIRWVVADGQTIERKQQHRLSVALLSSPNCTISRNGAVFSS